MYYTTRDQCFPSSYTRHIHIQVVPREIFITIHCVGQCFFLFEGDTATEGVLLGFGIILLYLWNSVSCISCYTCTQYALQYGYRLDIIEISSY